MKMKKEKDGLEQLLNSLIKRGWKPFGIKSDNIWLYWLSDNKIVISYYEFDTEGECNHEDKWCDLRHLTSKESGLWQFVCKNKLLKHGVYTGAKWQRRKKYDNYWNTDIQVYKPEYRLIESALCNEDKLEDFLLSNIKVDE